MSYFQKQIDEVYKHFKFLATGVVPQEGQRTSSADNSVEPVLNMVVRHDC